MKTFKELTEEQKKDALNAFMRNLDNIPKNEDWENKALNYLRRSKITFSNSGKVIIK